MNKNVTPLILIVLAIGIYFTYTKGQINEMKAIRVVNAGYEQALSNSEKLIKTRDEVLNTYNNIAEEDRARLEKMLPDNVDNIRLIIDVNGVAARYGLTLKNIKTNASAVAPTNTTSTVKPGQNTNTNMSPTMNIPNTVKIANSYDTVILSFSVNTNYQTFINLLRDLEASLRIMDISKITVTANDTGLYDYGVELKTYWLKQ
jgi:Tfp pilus assembly protein PilO